MFVEIQLGPSLFTSAKLVGSDLETRSPWIEQNEWDIYILESLHRFHALSWNSGFCRRWGISMFSTAGMALLLGRLCQLLSLRCSEETGRSSVRKKHQLVPGQLHPPKFNREPKNESLEDEFPWKLEVILTCWFLGVYPQQNHLVAPIWQSLLTAEPLSSMPLDSLWPMVIKTRKPCGFQRFH